MSSRHSGVCGLSAAALSALLVSSTLPVRSPEATAEAGVSSLEHKLSEVEKSSAIPASSKVIEINGESFSVSIPVPESAKEIGLRRIKQDATDERNGTGFEIQYDGTNSINIEMFVVPSDGKSALREMERASKELSTWLANEQKNQNETCRSFSVQRIVVDGAKGNLIEYCLDKPAVHRRTTTIDFNSGGKDYSLVVRANFFKNNEIEAGERDKVGAVFNQIHTSFTGIKINIAK